MFVKKLTNLVFQLSKLNSQTIRFILLITLLIASFAFPGVALAGPGGGGSGSR